MRVSVVIPCYNSMRFLPETLASVLDQDLPADVTDYEVVIVDDGGSDDVGGWASTLDDDRVRVVRQENAGVSAARNAGVASARGDLIGFCDSDDLWTPTTVAALVAPFRVDPQVGLSHGWYDVIDAHGRPIGRVSRSDLEGQVWERLVLDNPIAASGAMVRRAVMEELGGFAVNRDRFRIDVEDWELWIRIAARWPIGLARRIVAHHRRHDSNSSVDVESIADAYDHMLDVVFADVDEDRRRLQPAARARIDVRLASHWLNDRQDARRGLAYLAAASSLDPSVRRTGEFWRLWLSGRALRVAGPRGFAAIRSGNRRLRGVLEAVRGRSEDAG